jgi:hypothetical protein
VLSYRIHEISAQLSDQRFGRAFGFIEKPFEVEISLGPDCRPRSILNSEVNDRTNEKTGE